MDSSQNRTGYSIASVSKLTGVSCHTLRVWERRYGFPVAERTPSGQRRYSAETVDALRRISSVQKSGRSIGAVIAEHLARIVASPTVESTVPAAAYVSRFLEAVLSADEETAVAALDQARGAMSIRDLVSNVVEPAMIEVGERWFRGEFHVFHERFASSLLLRRLDLLADEVKRANPAPGGRVLVCTLQGDRHEGGVRMLCLSLELIGKRSVCLGVDLPSEELAQAVERWRPEAVAVSFVLSRSINKRFDELSGIKSVPVFVGGRSLTNYHKLAREHGLIPLSERAIEIADRWEEEYRLWTECRTE